MRERALWVFSGHHGKFLMSAIAPKADIDWRLPRILCQKRDELAPLHGPSRHTNDTVWQCTTRGRAWVSDQL